MRQIIFSACFLFAAWAGAADVSSSSPEVVVNGYILSVTQSSLGQLEAAKKTINQYVYLGAAGAGNECVASSVGIFLPSSDLNYYGDFIVKLTSNCKVAADQILKNWEQNSLIQVYHDGEIAPFPAVILSN